MRSLLLVPAGRAALEAALAARPDALLFDLGDPARDERGHRRGAVAELLAEAASRPGRPRLLVGLAPLANGLVDADLDAIVGAGPDAVVAPEVVGLRDVEHLGAKLAVAEAVAGRPAGETGIVALAGDTARGILSLGTFVRTHPRLRALAFDGRASGAPGSAPARAARGALVLAAMAAGVPALDLTQDAPGDLATACGAAGRDGFSGRLARDPSEVAAIAAAFAR